MAPGDLPAFPEDTGFHYLAEGAANIVYRISIKPKPKPLQQTALEESGDRASPPAEIDDNPVPLWERPYESKLLRVRKNLPTTAPCAVAQLAWMRYIKPLFPEHQLVHQSLVELRPGKVIERLNEELRGWELYEYPVKGSLRSVDPRPTKRHGIYLADDEHGLLVTDMTPRGEVEEVLEFKPKWLSQSPSAPKNSKRCRQCAHVARMNAQRAQNGEPPAKLFCPLDLTSSSHRDIQRVAHALLAPDTDAKILRFAKWLENTTLLRNLKSCQEMLDKVGVMDGDVNNMAFLTAMTLRDCTVFLRLPDETGEIEARIGDLDLKSKDKIEYWRSMEKPLIEEGWYEGLEDYEVCQPLTCHLSPERWGPLHGMRRTTL